MSMCFMESKLQIGKLRSLSIVLNLPKDTAHQSLKRKMSKPDKDKTWTTSESDKDSIWDLKKLNIENALAV